MNKPTRVLISDFDGTISKTDFFHYVIDNLLTQSDLKPWDDYLAKKITHIEALHKIFSKIRMSISDFHKFILNLPIEDCFVDTVHYCKENNVDFYIVSAGADYYIKLILGKLKVDNLINLYSNESFFSERQGLQILKIDENQPFYSHNYGISKKLIVESLKKKYDICIFAGDGIPDFEAAKLADVVFARDKLLELCKENNVNAIELKSYCNILDYLKNE